MKSDFSIVTEIEAQRFTELETAIERGVQTFVEVGNALIEIRDSRLYRADYGTFEDYCRERWGFTDRRARQLMTATEIVTNIQTGTAVPVLPQTERQARGLSGLTPDQQREVWRQVITDSSNSKPTAIDIERVVNEYNYKRDNRRSQPSDIYMPSGMDACQTPAYAIDPLLPYLPREWIIWEPACGEGLLVEALYDSDFKQEHVIASDILAGQNFFEYEPDEWDYIVTNPPYSIQFQWLERCYQLGKPFALLLKVEILGTNTAQILMKQYGFEIMLLDKRVDFKMPNKGWDSSAQFPTFWLCWQLLPEKVMFGTINKND